MYNTSFMKPNIWNSYFIILYFYTNDREKDVKSICVS